MFRKSSVLHELCPFYFIQKEMPLVIDVHGFIQWGKKDVLKNLHSSTGKKWERKKTKGKLSQFIVLHTNSRRYWET